MNTCSEFLEDIDSKLLAQSNTYNATDVQYLPISDGNQRQYPAHYINFDQVNVVSSTLNEAYHFSEQLMQVNYEVTLDLTGATFKKGVVSTIGRPVDNAGANIADATQVVGANRVKLTSTTVAGATVPSKKAFRLKGNHHLVDNVQVNLGDIPLNTTYSLCNV
jgi:hypothetical protein